MAGSRSLVEFLARWQGKAKPTLDNPMVAIFAGNHGVTDQGVSAFPREVTAQMVANFTEGGAAISQICALHELNLRVFELALELPTGDITREPRDGRQDVRRHHRLRHGGDRRQARPALPSARWASATPPSRRRIYAALYGGTGADWVGRGTGVDDAGLARKADAVDRALALHKADLDDPLSILARLGGREIAAMLGALIAARQQKMPVIVDGFVATSAAAIAHAVNPARDRPLPLRPCLGRARARQGARSDGRRRRCSISACGWARAAARRWRRCWPRRRCICTATWRRSTSAGVSDKD